jgi:hypothetical protein
LLPARGVRRHSDSLTAMNASTDGGQLPGAIDEGGEAPCFAHLFEDPTMTEPPRSPSVHEETLTDAINRLRADGYVAELSATEDGHLLCRSCGKTYDPLSLQIDHRVRFEGDSNPDDEAILLAVRDLEGCMGLFSAAFGPSASPEDAAVLRRLARSPVD